MKRRGLLTALVVDKKPIVAVSVGLKGIDYVKPNRNMYLPVKMRGQPTSYGHAFIRDENEGCCRLFLMCLKGRF